MNNEQSYKGYNLRCLALLVQMVLWLMACRTWWKIVVSTVITLQICSWEQNLFIWLIIKCTCDLYLYKMAISNTHQVLWLIWTVISNAIVCIQKFDCHRKVTLLKCYQGLCIVMYAVCNPSVWCNFLFYFYRIMYYISHHWFIAGSESVLCLYDIVLRYDLTNLEIRHVSPNSDLY